MPRPRFSLRTLLLAVTVVAVGCGAWVWANAKLEARRSRFELLMYYHFSKIIAGTRCSGPKSYCDEYFEKYHAFTDYHSKMGEKYEAAYYKPWMPVATDPPEPESPFPHDQPWTLMLEQTLKEKGYL